MFRPVRTAAALLAVPLAACSSGGVTTSRVSGPAGVPTSSVAGPAGTGLTIRFVNVMPAGRGTLEVDVDGKPVVASLAPGAVSDYVTVPLSSATVILAAGRQIGAVTGAQRPGARFTYAVGLNLNGDPSKTEWEEHGSIVTAASLDVGTDPRPSAPDKANVIGNDYGDGMHDFGVRLGQPGKGCVPGLQDEGEIYQMTSPHSRFFAPPGALSLAWYHDRACTVQMSAPVSVSVPAGHDIYAFTWLSDPTHARLIALPVTPSGKGTEGMVTSGPGPAIPPSGTVIDSDTPSASPSDSTSANSTPTDSTPTDSTPTSSVATDDTPVPSGVSSS